MTTAGRRIWRRFWPALLVVPFVLATDAVLWRSLDQHLYDLGHSLRPAPSFDDVLVVGIDAATRRELPRPVHPLSRHIDHHAQLVRTLRAAGARGIVLDLALTTDTLADDPAPLADAIGEAGNVVLVSTLIRERLAGGAAVFRSERPDTLLTARARATVLSQVQLDGDGVFRRLRPARGPGGRSLTTVPEFLAGVRLARPTPVVFPARGRPVPQVSYRNVLAARDSALAGVAGKIVFVGEVDDAIGDIVSIPRRQMLAGGREGWYLPGVVALAAATQTMLVGSPLRDATGPGLALILLAWSAIALLLSPERRPLVAGVAAVALVAAAAAATAAMHAWLDLVVPGGAVIGVVGLSAAAAGVAAAFRREKRLTTRRLAALHMQQQLEMARRTQEMFLPSRFPELPGLSMWGVNVSSPDIVSGDYFDLVARPDGSLLLAVGDVSGKGLPAALVMASVQTGLRTALLHGVGDLGAIVASLNTHVVRHTAVQDFVTFLVGEISGPPWRLTYVRAGHDIPFIIDATGTARHLTDGGLFLGLAEDIVYEPTTVSLSPGDLVCFYTDGITEAPGAGDEQYGPERLVRAVADARSLPPHAICREILEQVETFTRRAPASDDRTLVLVRIDG